MTQATDTDRRPRLIDRFRAAIDAFRNAQRAYVQGVLTGVRLYPQIAADLTTR